MCRRRAAMPHGVSQSEAHRANCQQTETHCQQRAPAERHLSVAPWLAQSRIVEFGIIVFFEVSRHSLPTKGPLPASGSQSRGASVSPLKAMKHRNESQKAEDGCLLFGSIGKFVQQREKLHGQREHNGRVLFHADFGQRLQVAQLQRTWVPWPAARAASTSFCAALNSPSAWMIFERFSRSASACLAMARRHLSRADPPASLPLKSPSRRTVPCAGR